MCVCVCALNFRVFAIVKRGFFSDTIYLQIEWKKSFVMEENRFLTSILNIKLLGYEKNQLDVTGIDVYSL